MSKITKVKKEVVCVRCDAVLGYSENPATDIVCVRCAFGGR